MLPQLSSLAAASEADESSASTASASVAIVPHTTTGSGVHSYAGTPSAGASTESAAANTGPASVGESPAEGTALNTIDKRYAGAGPPAASVVAMMAGQPASSGPAAGAERKSGDMDAKNDAAQPAAVTGTADAPEDAALKDAAMIDDD